jgi:hypothetical protein
MNWPKTLASISVTPLLAIGFGLLASQAGEYAPDPGIRPLAVRLAVSTRTVPFEGRLLKFRGYAWSLPKQSATFARAYSNAIHSGLTSRDLQQNPWITNMGGPAPPNELLSSMKSKVVWASFCQEHNCGGHRVLILYDPLENALWGIAYFDNASHLIGNPSTSQEALLLLLLCRERVSAATWFPLAAPVLKQVQGCVNDSDGNLFEVAAYVA